MRRPRGFTLMEMLVVVTILGILAAFAIPSYRDATVRARRVVAKAMLSEIAGREEGWFSDRKTYTASLGADGLNYVAGNAVTGFNIDLNGKVTTSASAALYAIALATTRSGTVITGYTITATPLNAQEARDKCGWLRLAQDGARSAQSGNPDCWAR